MFRVFCHSHCDYTRVEGALEDFLNDHRDCTIEKFEFLADEKMFRVAIIIRVKEK